MEDESARCAANLKRLKRQLVEAHCTEAELRETLTEAVQSKLRNESEAKLMRRQLGAVKEELHQARLDSMEANHEVCLYS
ncbi:unnamed protein product [Protopolystoma xenopodis]|uniref:Uncharacterized protein n=1 Tax=Protopolystoma xenopodis TaxID=117903 RepID=A0A3S5FDM2_9PLAT|nr:unnamed protein product [Protopolystoma xenopodis]